MCSYHPLHLTFLKPGWPVSRKKILKFPLFLLNLFHCKFKKPTLVGFFVWACQTSKEISAVPHQGGDRCFWVNFCLMICWHHAGRISLPRQGSKQLISRLCREQQSELPLAWWKWPIFCGETCHVEHWKCGIFGMRVDKLRFWHWYWGGLSTQIWKTRKFWNPCLSSWCFACFTQIPSPWTRKIWRGCISPMTCRRIPDEAVPMKTSSPARATRRTQSSWSKQRHSSGA